MTSGAPLLTVRGISKRFGDVVANDGVNLTIRAGQVHALLGENGAGKSALVKILYGVYRPDAGTIERSGAAATVSSPANARDLGLGSSSRICAWFPPCQCGRTSRYTCVMTTGGCAQLAPTPARSSSPRARCPPATRGLPRGRGYPGRGRPTARVRRSWAHRGGTRNSPAVHTTRTGWARSHVTTTR